MRRLQKSKRVSWASDLDLCQVRLFLSEESPSQVGLNSQHHLQAKTSLLLHPDGEVSDDILPPGFEGTHAKSQSEIKLSQIPVIKWIAPPKIALDAKWQVAVGVESKEVEDQRQREMRVLEAIYPRISSIPQNPSVSMDVEESHCTDDQTALIPIIPIEDEDAAAKALLDSLKPFDVSQSLQLAPGILKDSNSAASMQLACGLASDVVAAAFVALTSLVKRNEHGNFIDHESVNNILNNPEVIVKLVRDYRAANNSQYVHNAGSSLAAFSNPSIPIQGETTTPSSVVFSGTSSYAPPTGGQVEPITTQWPPRPATSSAIVSSPIEVPPARNVNYYKSLIQQHGGDKQETLPYSSKRQIPQSSTNYETTSYNHKVSKPKIMKPCIFFNTSKGCRKGANCAYQHDASF